VGPALQKNEDSFNQAHVMRLKLGLRYFVVLMTA
jgi:hypothetical protein